MVQVQDQVLVREEVLENVHQEDEKVLVVDQEAQEDVLVNEVNQALVQVQEKLLEDDVDQPFN